MHNIFMSQPEGIMICREDQPEFQVVDAEERDQLPDLAVELANSAVFKLLPDCLDHDSKISHA